jgi:hypothetical protein
MKKGFKLYCRRCRRPHIMIMGKCPGCGVHEIPVPKSDNVADNCRSNEVCEGCESYEDHLR